VTAIEAIDFLMKEADLLLPQYQSGVKGTLADYRELFSNPHALQDRKAVDAAADAVKRGREQVLAEQQRRRAEHEAAEKARKEVA